MILIATPAPDDLLNSTLAQLRLPGTHPLFLRRDAHTAQLLMPRQDTPVATLRVSPDRRTVQADTPTGTLTLSELHFNRAANSFDTASTEDLATLNAQLDTLNADHLIQDLIGDYARAEQFTVTEFFPDAQANLIDALLFNPDYPTPDAPQYVGVNLIRLEDRYRLTSGSTAIADYVHDGQTWTWVSAASQPESQPEDQPAAAPTPVTDEPAHPAPVTTEDLSAEPTPSQSGAAAAPAPTVPRQLFTPNPIPTPRTDS